jgi:hypothetical protein
MTAIGGATTCHTQIRAERTARRACRMTMCADGLVWDGMGRRLIGKADPGGWGGCSGSGINKIHRSADTTVFGCACGRGETGLGPFGGPCTPPRRSAAHVPHGPQFDRIANCVVVRGCTEGLIGHNAVNWSFARFVGNLVGVRGSPAEACGQGVRGSVDLLAAELGRAS